MSNSDLIIFDCDGTLVDSELLCNQSASEVLAAIGYPQYTPEYCLRTFIGCGQSVVWKTVSEETGSTLPADINQRFIDRVAFNMDAMAKPAPGIVALLEAVSKTHRICVGSNGERPNVVGALKSTGLLRFFPAECIFTVEDVANPKPAPDLYLHAAAKMGFTPDRCVVVEDSVAGATAGVAAGMKVFGYYGLAHHPAQQAENLCGIGVHTTSAALDDLINFIRS